MEVERGKRVSSLPFLSVSGLSGPVARGLLSDLVCLQVPTQLCADYVYLCVCAHACMHVGTGVCVYLPVNADVPTSAHAGSVCAYVELVICVPLCRSLCVHPYHQSTG